jgi:uncharacterized membrane-anchored protein YjiN (DUF445 family)
MQELQEIYKQISAKIDRKISDDSERFRIKFIFKTFENRKLSRMTVNALNMYTTFLLGIKDKESRDLAFKRLFEDLLTDCFPADSKDYHIEKYADLC